MTFRFNPWLLVAGLMGLIFAAVGGLYYYRARVDWTPQVMTSYLPRVNAAVVYLDIEKLRDAGLLEILAGSRAVEEPEYRKFVGESGFDYRTDLDRVAISFQGDNRYLVVRGKFDWMKLNQFAVHRGGLCRNSVCNYSQPDTLNRFNSFYPLRPNVMTLYTGTSDWGVYEVSQNRIDPATFPIPDAPVWALLPSILWRQATLPPGAKAFASLFGEADSILMSITQESTTRFHMAADLSCSDPKTATSIHLRLREATDLLNKMMAREHQVPNPHDLSGVLSGGSFQVDGTHVKANWPIEKGFLESIADGK